MEKLRKILKGQDAEPLLGMSMANKERRSVRFAQKILSILAITLCIFGIVIILLFKYLIIAGNVFYWGLYIVGIAFVVLMLLSLVAGRKQKILKSSD